jgi:ABC-type transport system involved in multi-copper enzyme maturation permease subunit
MMMKSDIAASGSLFRSTVAEFLKFYAFRIPQIAYVSIAVFPFLFVIQLFYVERLSAHLGSTTVTEVIPYLFFASWKTILLQLFVIAFTAYCIAVDSQYGMIRIGCTQPVSRAQYILGKSIAIELHVALFALVYIASLFLWVGIYTGFHGLSPAGLVAIASVATRTVVFCCGLSGCMIGVSILRKTLLDAFVSCCVVFVAFALLTTLPPRFHVESALFLRYFFYPIAAILPKGWPIPFPMKDAPLPQFLLVSLVTPTVCFLPALVHFHFRDISE